MSVDGVLVVDKPAGPTSHDVVSRVRGILGQRRVGHTGTLDPFATGVLPVCVGRATRLSRHLSGDDKVYRGVVRLGYATTTDDIEGEPLGAPAPLVLDAARLEAARAGLIGAIMQRPPLYSAKRVGGRRMHEMARRGELVEATPVRVTIHRLDILGVEGESVEIEVHCSSGTYIRAIARDLGEILGCGGHLTALRRVKSGSFGLDRAVKLDGLDRSAAREALVPMRQLLAHWPCVSVGDDGIADLRHGRDIELDRLEGAPQEGAVRVMSRDGELLALGTIRPGLVVPGLSVPSSLHPDTVLMEVAGRPVGGSRRAS